MRSANFGCREARDKGCVRPTLRAREAGDKGCVRLTLGAGKREIKGAFEYIRVTIAEDRGWRMIEKGLPPHTLLCIRIIQKSHHKRVFSF